MRILVFADTHGTLDFSHLEEPAAEADLILCAGDLTDFSDEIEEVLEALEAFAERVDKKVIFVHGNHEGSQVRELAEGHEHLVYVHGTVYLTKGVAIVGYGGGGFSVEDHGFEDFVSTVHDDDRIEDRLVVWLLHGPPYDMVVDVVPGYGPTGCLSKRRMIEALQPHIVVSGHIHEAWGETHEHGRTLLINPGPYGVLIDVGDEE